jgi:hypothetical protein
MPRIALILVLVLTTLAGPWLCCCTVVACATQSKPDGTDAPPATSVRPVCSCCAAEADAAPTVVAAPSAAAVAQPAKPLSSCPCQACRPVAARLGDSQKTSDHSRKVFDTCSLADFSASAALVVLTAAADAGRVGAPLAVSNAATLDLLHLCHALRC